MDVGGLPLLVGRGVDFFFLGLTSIVAPARRAVEVVGLGEAELAITEVVVVVVVVFGFFFLVLEVVLLAVLFFEEADMECAS